MLMDQNLANIFNVDLAIQEISPIVPSDNSDEITSDFNLARNTLRKLLDVNNDLINNIVDNAKSSERSSAFEVAGQLIKTQTEIAKSLLSVQKQNKDLKDSDTQPKIGNQTNNILFAGSTADLMKIISERKANIIESK